MAVVLLSLSPSLSLELLPDWFLMALNRSCISVLNACIGLLLLSVLLVLVSESPS